MLDTAVDPQEHAQRTCSAVLGDARVYPLMQQWGAKAKAALDARGLRCQILDDELTMELISFGRQYVLGVEVWDPALEFAWRLRLEFSSSTDPNTLGFTEVLARFGVGGFNPDSELDTWTFEPMFSVLPPESPPAGPHAPEVVAGQALTKVVQWHNRLADNAFSLLAQRIDESLRP